MTDRRVAVLCLLCLAALWFQELHPADAAPALKWHTSIERAQAATGESGKLIFALFTGSDRGGINEKLETEILTTPEFRKWAGKVVLFKADYPKNQSNLSAERKEDLKDIRSRYGIGRLPAIRLLNADGEKVGTLKYMAGGPAKWIPAADKALADAGQPQEAEPGPLTFTYLVADGVGTMGSTAFRVEGKGAPTIYIEAFPARDKCKSDPFEITKADLIIQGAHGHFTHYDAKVCATVARNTGALVLGNAMFKKDMLENGIPAEKIIELSPKPGEKVSTMVKSLGIKVTSYRMTHTMMGEAPVDTFLVEMPGGVRWYHGTCSSGPLTMKWMQKFPELKDLDVMLMDCDVDFARIKPLFNPRVLIRTHDFKSPVNPKPATLYTDYPKGEKVLNHGDSWVLGSAGESD